MIHWDKFTPGLCKIAEELPQSHARRWNEIIQPILEREDFIYEAVFRSFSIKEHWKKTNRFARRTFYEFLREEEIEFQELPIEHVLNTYLFLCEDSRYWKNGQIGGLDQHFEFEATLEIWTPISNRAIQRCTERLNEWKRVANS